MIDIMELYVKYELGIGRPVSHYDDMSNDIEFIKDVHQAYRVYYDCDAVPEPCNCGGVLRYEGYEYHQYGPVYRAFMLCNECGCGYEF